MKRRLVSAACIVAAMMFIGPRAADLGAAVPARTTLADLAGVDELRAMFNRDRGKARLVLLLSPT